jgi:hypothetical protein
MPKLLLVEARDYHALLMQWVFSQPPPWEVAWVADGAEALDFLQRKRKRTCLAWGASGWGPFALGQCQEAKFT